MEHYYESTVQYSAVQYVIGSMFPALWLILLLPARSSLASFSCGANDHPEDCAALNAVYASTTFAPTGARLPWPGPSSFCEWAYVTCWDAHSQKDETHREVRVLDLHNLVLNGSIPPGIARLSRPRSLYLYANELSGTIPAALGALTSLRDLQLDQNLLTGALPESLGNLSNLQYLGFSFNKLSGTLPESFGNLVNLRTLKGDYNQLQGTIPASFGQLTSLVYCVLSYNQLQGAVPESFGNLSARLFDLELHNNYLTSLPRTLGGLRSLTSLSVGFNLLSGPIPAEWFVGDGRDGGFPKLEGLFMENNNFSGPIPPGLGSLQALRQLELDHNALAGAVPEALGALSLLETLHLNDNALEGLLPTGLWSNLTHVVSLFLSGPGNQFTPPLPASLEALACSGGALSEPGTQCRMPTGFPKAVCEANPCLVKVCNMVCSS